MGRSRGVVALAAALALATVASAACVAPVRTGGAASGSGDGPARLGASASQFREDEVRGQVRVRLTSTAPVRVATLRLEWAGLPDLAATAPDYPLAAGVPVDLPVPLAPAACGQPPAADAVPPPTGPGAVTAVVGITGPSGAVTEERVPVTGAGPTLDRVFARACRTQALDSLVAAAFGDDLRPVTRRGLPALAGTITLTRRAAPGPVTVAAIDGSVLLAVDPRPATAVPATLRPGAPDLAVPVTITTSGRCDGHALGESKQTYVVDVLVDVGGAAGLTGAEPVTVTVPEQRQPLVWDTMLRACARLDEMAGG